MTYIKSRQNAEAANATINRELAALKRSFRLGLRAGLVGKVPYIGLLREDNARQGFFELEHFEAVRRHLPEPLRAVVTFAYITGWRIRSEVLTLRWSQVDFQHGWVRLEPGTTKNKLGRMFPLTPELRAVLEAQRQHTDSLQKSGTIIPYVFHRDGRPIHYFRRSWLTACTLAGCPGRIPHDFRRTAVRNLERAGISRSAAMALVGHKTQSIYNRYAIVAEQDLKDAGEKLATLHQAPVKKGKVTQLRPQ